jgi:hypothetical protein
MAIDVLKTVDIIETMENYLERQRPPEHIRNKVDLGYKIENQSIILTEIRPAWDNPSQINEHGYAKATYIKKQDVWKIYWMRGNLKWNLYDPKPQVKKLSDFLEVVEKDELGCFKG